MVERYSKPRDVATIQFAVIGTRTSRSPALALVLPEKAIPPAVRSGIDQALQVAQTSPADYPHEPDQPADFFWTPARGIV